MPASNPPPIAFAAPASPCSPRSPAAIAPRFTVESDDSFQTSTTLILQVARTGNQPNAQPSAAAFTASHTLRGAVNNAVGFAVVANSRDATLSTTMEPGIGLIEVHQFTPP